MNDLPEHVEPLWSRVDDLTERVESFNGVLGLHSSQIGFMQRTIDDLSREMADRFSGATRTFGSINDRIHALESTAKTDVDRFEVLEDQIDELSERLTTAVATGTERYEGLYRKVAALEAAAQPDESKHQMCGKCSHLRVLHVDDEACTWPDCPCLSFMSDAGPVADDLTIARMEALETAIDFITKHIDNGYFSMAVCRDRLQVWLDELSDPVVER